jgi:hypothetical protein
MNEPFDINGEIKIGDGVSLRHTLTTPPHIMNVEQVLREEGKPPAAICSWHDVDGKPQTEHYVLAILYRNQVIRQKIDNLVYCWLYLSDGSLMQCGSYGTRDPKVIAGYNAPSNQSPDLPTPEVEQKPLEWEHQKELAKIAAGKSTLED